MLYGWREDAAHYFVPDRTQSSVFEIDRPQASPFHLTTKPIELVARMIRAAWIKTARNGAKSLSLRFKRQVPFLQHQHAECRVESAAAR